MIFKMHSIVWQLTEKLKNNDSNPTYYIKTW